MASSANDRARSSIMIAVVTAFVAFGAILMPITVRAEPPVPRTLVLEDPSLPDYDAPLNEMLRRTLASAGYAVVPVTVDALRSEETLAPANRCALLVLPQARRLPAPLIPAVEAYARRGGNLVVLGAPE